MYGRTSTPTERLNENDSLEPMVEVPQGSLPRHEFEQGKTAHGRRYRKEPAAYYYDSDDDSRYASSEHSESSGNDRYVERSYSRTRHTARPRRDNHIGRRRHPSRWSDDDDETIDRHYRPTNRRRDKRRERSYESTRSMAVRWDTNRVQTHCPPLRKPRDAGGSAEGIL